MVGAVEKLLESATDEATTMTKLVLKYNGAVVKEFTVDKDAVAIGRHPESDLLIDNPAVSGRHCRVVKENGAFFVEDLDSTNGTFLRGLEITKAPLRHQDEFAVAKHTVLFLDADAPAAPPAPAPVSTDATVIMTAPPATPAPAPQTPGRVGCVKILIGGEPGEKPIPLTAFITYIGKSSQAQIKLKGMFQPDLAACVSKKPDGFYLTALKDKTVKLNGNPLMDQAQVPLQEGDLIDVGPLKMAYILMEMG